MAVALDTSALLALAVDGPQRAVVLDALEADQIWAASARALTDELILRADLEDATRLALDQLHVVLVDQRCLDRAAALTRTQPVRLTDSVHYAGAERLPQPVTLRLLPDGTADGVGPNSTRHHRFRAWKEHLARSGPDESPTDHPRNRADRDARTTAEGGYSALAASMSAKTSTTRLRSR